MTLWLMLMHHHTKFGNKMFCSLENTIWTNTDILTLHCNLDLKCNNPFLNKTLWLMMMYHQTRFNCQGIKSSEDTVESYFDHMSPCSDLDLEDKTMIFSPGLVAKESMVKKI